MLAGHKLGAQGASRVLRVLAGCWKGVGRVQAGCELGAGRVLRVLAGCK